MLVLIEVHHNINLLTSNFQLVENLSIKCNFFFRKVKIATVPAGFEIMSYISAVDAL